MLVGYGRVSKSDGNLDLQKDALIEGGVDEQRIYADFASGKKDDRPELINCLKSLRDNEDTLVVWKLDRLGRSLSHLVKIVKDLEDRGIGLKVLTGKGACIETTTPAGRMIFAVFAALSEYERELIVERTKAGLDAARARGRKGGRKFQMNKTKLTIAVNAMKSRETKVSDLCEELKISRHTLYRYVSPEGEIRDYGKKILEA